ncbi:MAG: hypothetical protein ABIB04_04385 [Patescibacteria group bacterium]
MSIESAKRAAELTAIGLLAGILENKKPDVAVILGSGWGDALHLENAQELNFLEIPSFRRASVRGLHGDERQIVCGELGGKRVIALRGPIHLNEHSSDPYIPIMVRLQVQILLELGVTRFILTNAAGSLTDKCLAGDIVIADGFVTLFAPPMPLFGGEFCSPEDALSDNMRGIAMEARVLKNQEILLCHTGGYVMLRGPFFEGRKYDKALLARSGALAVGMSILPEMCIIALYPDTKALCLSFITNSVDEKHSHEKNLARVGKSSALLGAFLEDIIRKI